MFRHAEACHDPNAGSFAVLADYQNRWKLQFGRNICGSQELKPESDVALQEIAKLLTQDPTLKLLVVGHTDNVGGYDANMTLSERRPRPCSRRLPRSTA